MKQLRQVKQVIKGLRTSDGDGVQLTRIIGSHELNMLDPFLLLDAFGTDKPQDYIGGFPAHPHRGFETVTYMLAGKMRHKDNTGNSGVIEAGGVQWMTAGKGIIHSEMPEQTEGLLAGFQLWVNLPAKKKMIDPYYQEWGKEQIPETTNKNGVTIKIIAGTTKNGVQGIIKNDDISPIYWDVNLPKDTDYLELIPQGHNAFIYVIEGNVSVADYENKLSAGELAVLEQGDEVKIQAHEKSRLLVIAGKPLNEPVARGGPFVMNSKEEINQAFLDYQSGTFA